MEAKILISLIIVTLLSAAGVKRAATSPRVEALFSLVVLTAIWGFVILGARYLEAAMPTRFAAYNGQLYQVVDSGKLLKLKPEQGGQVIIVPAAMTKKAV